MALLMADLKAFWISGPCVGDQPTALNYVMDAILQGDGGKANGGGQLAGWM